MKILAKTVLVTALLAALCRSTTRGHCVANDSPEAIAGAVRAVYAEMISAAESLNVDALFAHVAEADRGAIAVDGRIFATRTEALARTRENLAGLRALKYDNSSQDVIVLSSTSALMVTRLTTQAETLDGRTFSRSSVMTVVFVLRDGKWKVVHSHQSNAPQT